MGGDGEVSSGPERKPSCWAALSQRGQEEHPDSAVGVQVLLVRSVARAAPAVTHTSRPAPGWAAAQVFVPSHLRKAC